MRNLGPRSPPRECNGPKLQSAQFQTNFADPLNSVPCGPFWRRWLPDEVTAAYKKLASAGLLSRLLCLLLSRLHSLQRSFDGNQAFAQNADSVEKTIEGVFVNRGWFRHNACHRINPEEGKSARWRTSGWI